MEDSTSRLRSRGRRIIALLICGALAFGLAVWVWLSRVDNTGGLFAYVRQESPSATELVVMHGDEVVAREKAALDVASEPVWTYDGHYVAALKTHVSESGLVEVYELVSIDARTGAKRNYPCPKCSDLAAIGDSEVLLSAHRPTDPHKMTVVPTVGVVNLDKLDPPAYYTTNLPEFLAPVKLLTSNRDTALVSGSNTLLADTEERLFLLDRTGKAKELGKSGNNALVYAAAATDSGPGGKPMFALHIQEQVAAEGRASDLLLLDPVTAKQTPTDMTTLSSQVLIDAPAGAEAVAYARDIWWSRDGHLYGVWTVIADDGKWGAEPVVTLPTVWRLDGTRWIKIGDEPVLAVRELESKAKAALVPDSPDGLTGTLFIERDGERNKLADNVSRIIAPERTPAIPSS